MENPETDPVSRMYVLTDKMPSFLKWGGKKAVGGNYVQSMLVDKFSEKKNKNYHREGMTSDDLRWFSCVLNLPIVWFGP